MVRTTPKSMPLLASCEPEATALNIARTTSAPMGTSMSCNGAEAIADTVGRSVGVLHARLSPEYKTYTPDYRLYTRRET